MPRTFTARAATNTARLETRPARAQGTPSARVAPPSPAPRAAPEALAVLRAAAHPLRLRLLEMFARGARTTKQAAVALGEPPTRLYHHVHALERAGLVRVRETRAKRGTEEKYYELAPDLADGGWAGRVGAALTHAGPDDAPLAALADAMLDATRGDVLAALTGRGGGARPGPDAEQPVVARLVVPSAAVAAELRAELLALLRRHRTPAAAPVDATAAPDGESSGRGGGTGQAGDDADDAPAWSLTVVLVPLPPARAVQTGQEAADGPARQHGGAKRRR